LACGNSVVIKSPELSPLMLTFLARAAEAAGLPKGYLNIVCGYGTEAGEALASHPGIDHVTFTGSVATGRRVGVNAAQSIVPIVLELGGKGAGIVYEDADLDRTAHSAGIGIFAFAGQVCSAGSRLIVHSSVHDQLVEKLVAWTRTRTLGPGKDDHFFTPLISGPQRDKAENYCQIAIQQGAEAVIGGRRPDREGYFLEPTILTGVKDDHRVNNEEVFGPVLSVLKFDDPGGAGHRQWHGLRAYGGGLYKRSQTRPLDGGPAAKRHDLRQQMVRGRNGNPVRRVQALGPWPREEHGRAGELLPGPQRGNPALRR
jgi:acyl-CoA reductase-like NAD-dependent aldehyde dehydrogenase